MNNNGNGTNGNGKALRFAASIRVSTEKQEQKGESLRTQRKGNERDVDLLGGHIVEWYGGQEHATEGWERKELLRLAGDAAKDKFDATIITHADRWDRGSKEAKEALDTFKKHGIRFFISCTEYDLFNPEHVLFLDMSAAIGKFAAANQNKKSMLNRIARAKRNMPTCGKLPYGRTWDDDKEQWGIDPILQARIQDAARRYLHGESMPKLAKEYGMNHSNLCKLLRERCGSAWEIEFKADNLNIHEIVTLTIPPLLDDGTIRAIKERLQANRTYLHKPPLPKYEYLLAGRVFCAECGYCMFGQANHNGHRYYRHAHTERKRDCPLRPRPWVRADAIEQSVVTDLFRLFGNPSAIERAVKAAIPDCDKTLKQKQHLDEEIVKVDRSRDRLLDLIEKDAITQEDAEKKLRDLKERKALLVVQRDTLDAILVNVPSEQQLRCYVDACTSAREQLSGGEQVDDYVFLYDGEGNRIVGGNDIWSRLRMSQEDNRRLVEAVFAEPLSGGKPAGVYIQQDGVARPHRPKKWMWVIKGKLEFESVMRYACR